MLSQRELFPVQFLCRKCCHRDASAFTLLTDQRLFVPQFAVVSHLQISVFEHGFFISLVTPRLRYLPRASQTPVMATAMPARDRPVRVSRKMAQAISAVTAGTV